MDLNEGLEYLGRDSFARTTNLTAIWIPSTVVELARGVFYQSGLTSAYVPATVRSMGTHVFQECQRLTEVIFMANVNLLPESTFLNSVVLKEVYLREGIATVGPYAFYGCKSLTEITLPSSTKTINQYAFFACSKLEKLDFSNTQLASVGLAAFQHCLSLREAIFPYGFQSFAYGENYTYTDKAQFYGCTSLEKVVLPSTLSSCYWRYTIPNFSAGLVLNYLTNNYEILNHPFIDCNPSLVVYGYPDTSVAKLSTYTNVFRFSSLGSTSSENQNAITSPTSAPALPKKSDMVVTEVTPVPTPNASAESDFVLGAGGLITSYTGSGGNVVIPSTIGGRTVLGIAANVFQNKTNIDSVTMPNTLKRIEGYAFDGCTNLHSVTLNEGLEYLGRDCFARTTLLRDIWIPSTVVEFARGVFYRSGLTSAYVPDTVRIMGTHVFQECSLLSSAIIMADIDQLPESTFLNTTALKDVYLREGIVNIGPYAFYGCTTLPQITLPSTTKNIYDYAFYGCSKLGKLDFSNTRLSYVGLAAFQHCTSLSEAIFPYGFRSFAYGENTTYTDKAQFLGCSSLAKVVLPSTVSSCFYYQHLIVMILLNHPFVESNPSLVVYGYPNTSVAQLSSYTNVFTFSSLGDISKENQNPTIIPTSVPTLPTAPVTTTTPSITPEVTTPSSSYPTWASTYIDFVSSDIMTDISPENYGTASNRGLIAQSLYNMSGDGGTYASDFTDVGNYANAIGWCFENKVMAGNTSTWFNAVGDVSREEFALILRQLATVQGKDVSYELGILSDYPDGTSGNSWAQSGLAWAVKNGLMSGNANGTLTPNGVVSRVEVAVMLSNFTNLS